MFLYFCQCEKVIERETQMCKELLRAGKKEKAKLVLRKKKYQEKLLDSARQKLANIEEMIVNIEEAQMQQEIAKAMQQGTEVLKQINAQMSIEEIEQIMDDTQEAIEYQNEVNALLSQSLTDEDDEDVLKELALIEQEEADTQALEMPDVPMSNVNVDKDKNQIVEEEDDAPAKNKAKAKPVAMLA